MEAHTGASLHNHTKSICFSLKTARGVSFPKPGKGFNGIDGNTEEGPVKRILIVMAGVAAAISCMSGLVFTVRRAAAQTETGAICVATFADMNGNGQRDEGETSLDGVNVNLSTGGVIIGTHITAEGEDQYCFEHLLRGIYTITFTPSPTYRITTANEGTFALDAGQRLTIDRFGAFPVGMEGLRAEVAAQVAAARGSDKPLETSTRLLLSTVGSMLVMLFMVGVGAVILGLISSGRRPGKSRQQKTVRLPAEIKPPSP